MRYCLLFIVILCLLSFQLLRCGEDTEHPTTETPEAVVVNPNTAEQEIPVTPEAIFQKLWNRFGGRFGDNDVNFQGIREVTRASAYLDYLAAAFPTEEPFRTLEQYAQVAPPDPERYTPFLLEWVGVATAEDIAFIHWVVSSLREGEFGLINFRANAADAVTILFEKSFEPMNDPATEDFKRRHNIPDDEFTDRILAVRDAIALEDIAWLEEQMETHGTDVGLVWSAIYRPALMGEILHNLDSLEIWHAWVDFKTFIPAN